MNGHLPLTPSPTSYPFLQGGGEMGALTRAHNWAETPLGPPDAWPLSLRTTVGIVLHSAFPMFLFWGHELTCFYNDAYRPVLGNDGKHPALGKSANDVWPEVWDFIGPLIQQVITTGEPIFFEDQFVPIHRNGRLDDVYSTFSYSPAYGDDGQIIGVFVNCLETTEKIVNTKLQQEKSELLQVVFDSSSAGISVLGSVRNKQGEITDFDYRLVNHITERANNRTDLIGKRYSAIHPAYKKAGLFADFVQVVNTGQPLERERYYTGEGFNNWYETIAVKLDDGIVFSFRDITTMVQARQQRELTQQQVLASFEQSPVGIAIIGEENLTLRMVNPFFATLTGRTPGELIGKPMLEAIPELRGQGFDDLLRNVFATGNPFTAREVAVDVVRRDDQLETIYVDFTYQPQYEGDNRISGILVVCVDVTQQVLARKAVETSERYYRQLTDTVPAIIRETRPDGYCTYLNRQWYYLTGQTPAEAEGPGWLDAIHPDDRAKSTRLFLKANQNETPFNLVYRLRHRNSSYRWVIDKGSPRFGADGAYQGMIGTVVDIHDQQVAEENLRNSEAKLRSLIANAPVAIGLFVGRDLVVDLPNQTFIDIVGKGPDIAGRPLREVMPELATENQPFLQILDDVYTTGQLFQSFGSPVDIVQQGVMTHNYYNITYSPLRNEVGEVYAILDIAVDVTGQILAQQQVAESARQFRALLEAMPQMAWTNSPTGDVDFYNQRWYNYTGLTFAQTRDRGWEGIIHPDDLPQTLANFQHALTTDSEFMAESRYLRADGQYRWHLNRARPLHDESGRISQWVGTATDIQPQKELEAELEYQVVQRTQQLQASVQDLKRSNENLQQFAYVASHDLQEPLRKIQSFGDLLKSQYADQLGDGVDYLSRMQNSAQRMSTLIRDLLTYSRITTRQDATAPVSLDIVVNTVLADLELTIQETGAVVTIDPLPTVPGDHSQLGQLFQNLLSNALKFRQDGVLPRISVSTRQIPETDLPPAVRPTHAAVAYHQIDVADNGIGFDEKYLDRIFQVFQRLHGKTQFVGTGIGLAICEKVVTNHGGAITATSQPGQGATFSVFFPV